MSRWQLQDCFKHIQQQEAEHRKIKGAVGWDREGDSSSNAGNRK